MLILQSQTLANLDAERGVTDAANEELTEAHNTIQNLTSHLDEQRTRYDEAQRQIIELDGQLSTVGSSQEQFAKEKADLNDHISWLQKTSDMLEGKLQQAQSERDKVRVSFAILTHIS